MLQISGDNYPQNEYRIFADFTPCFSYFPTQNLLSHAETLLSDAKMTEDVRECFFCCNCSSCDVS